MFVFCTVAPKIDRRSLKPITIKVGQDFEFDVKVQGEPPPSISWMLGTKPVAERPTLNITNVPYNTKLTCDRAERKDNGVYKIIASNQYGTDEAEVEVNVICELLFSVHFTITGTVILLMQVLGTKVLSLLFVPMHDGKNSVLHVAVSLINVVCWLSFIAMVQLLKMLNVLFWWTILNDLFASKQSHHPLSIQGLIFPLLYVVIIKMREAELKR